MAARVTLSARMDALEAKFDKVLDLFVAEGAPARSKPRATARAKSHIVAIEHRPESDFTAALAAKREAKLADGAHHECPNCGKAISNARSTTRKGKVVCGPCFHASAAEYAARAKRAAAKA